MKNLVIGFVIGVTSGVCIARTVYVGWDWRFVSAAIVVAIVALIPVLVLEKYPRFV